MEGEERTARGRKTNGRAGFYWLPWLARELDLTLPVSCLFLLAAPKTPDEVQAHANSKAAGVLRPPGAYAHPAAKLIYGSSPFDRRFSCRRNPRASTL